MSTKALDVMRAALDHMDPNLRADQLEFFRQVLACGPDCIPELGQRVSRTQAPPALKALVLEGAFYHPWPGWVPVLARLLQYENDPSRFEVGARALGSVGDEAALEALRNLHTTRRGSPVEAILAEELRNCDPEEAFRHAFSQLLEGTANPKLANEAAFRLSQLVSGEHLETLQAAVSHPDLLVFRHGIQLISRVATKEAAQSLLEILREIHQECLEDRAIKETLAGLKSLTPVAALGELNERLAQLPEGADRLVGYAAFLVQTQTVALENKAHRLQSALAQVTDALLQRSRRHAFGVDAAAEGAAGLVVRELMDPAPLLELLRDAFRQRTGREGVARALALIMTPEDQESRELLLTAPEPNMRAAAVDVLGARLLPALKDLLVQFCKDPVSDIVDKALKYLGRLPDPESLARAFLQMPALGDQQLGLRFIAQERLTALTSDLLELLQRTSREDLALPILKALGSAGTAATGRTILDLLHSGQSRRMQIALAEAVRELADVDLALALGAKADALKLAQLHELAAEAHFKPWPPGQAMAEDYEDHFLRHVQEVWGLADAGKFRLKIAEGIRDRGLVSARVKGLLSQMFQEALATGKGAGGWSPAEVALVQQALKQCQ